MGSEKHIENETSDTIVNIPLWFKLFVLLVTVPVISTVLYLYWAYICEPLVYQSPASLGLPAIVIFCMSLLVFTFTPWNEVRMLFKKIGPLELQGILDTQAHERDEDLSNVEERLTTLEDKVFKSDELDFIRKSFDSPKLRGLLIAFLTAHEPTPYSPLRIKKWGVKQQNFEKLIDYELPHIREVLRELVADNILTTVVSEKGNTLYKLIS